MAYGLLGQFTIQGGWIDSFGEDYKDFTTLRPNMTGYNPDDFLMIFLMKKDIILYIILDI